MANGNGGNNDDLSSMSKGDLLDCIDSAVEILEAAYVPEADRETLASAVGDALDVLSGNGVEDDGDDSDDDDVR
jgi:hypothetical protein